MKANHRKATLVIVILLNLLLLGVCGWTLMTLLSPSDAPSEPDSSLFESAFSSEEPSFPSVKPESSTPENSSPTLSLPEGLALSDRFGNCYEAALNKLETLTIEEKLGQLLLCLLLLLLQRIDDIDQICAAQPPQFLVRHGIAPSFFVRPSARRAGGEGRKRYKNVPHRRGGAGNIVICLNRRA